MGRRPIEKRFYDLAEPQEVVVQFDVMNEQVVLAMALTKDDLRPKLVRTISEELFHSEKHKEAWKIVVRMVENRLEYDSKTLETLCGKELFEYLEPLVRIESTGKNLDQHVDRLRWDAARMRAAKGPLPRLLESIKDTREEPNVLATKAREVASCFDGFGETSALAAPGDTADEQAIEIRLRMAGKASYKCGIPDLDTDENGRPRLVPGFAPKRSTWITGVSGSGKSTFTAMLAYGLYKEGRTILYGGWEPGCGNVLELMGCWEAGIGREDLKAGICTDIEAKRHHEAMREIEKRVRLLKNPFRQGRVEDEQRSRGGFGKRDTTERRIDRLAQYIERSGCEIFVADLLRRAFVRFWEPGEEEAALYQVQDMKDQLGIHVIGLHQQLLKGDSFNKSKDHRPTGEGLKGSGGWFETGDLIIGVYREYLYRNVQDNRMELHILKQRDGKWPIALDFEYDSANARLGRGRVFDYRPNELSDDLTDGLDEAFREPRRRQYRSGARPSHLREVKNADDEQVY